MHPATRKWYGAVAVFLAGAAFLAWRTERPLRSGPLLASPETTHWTTPVDARGWLDFRACAERLTGGPVEDARNVLVLLPRLLDPPAPALALALPATAKRLARDADMPAFTPWSGTDPLAFAPDVLRWAVSQAPVGEYLADLLGQRSELRAAVVWETTAEGVSRALPAPLQSLEQAATLLLCRGMAGREQGDAEALGTAVGLVLRLNHVLSEDSFGVCGGALLQATMDTVSRLALDRSLSAAECLAVERALASQPESAFPTDLYLDSLRLLSLAALAARQRADGPLPPFGVGLSGLQSSLRVQRPEVNRVAAGINRHYDAVVAFRQAPTVDAQLQALLRPDAAADMAQCFRRRPRGLFADAEAKRAFHEEFTLASVRAVLGTSMARAVYLEARTSAARRQAVAALAMRRFELAHGRWPARLDDLVPAFLPAVPANPFTGEPIGLTIPEQGLPVLSSEPRTDTRRLLPDRGTLAGRR